MMFREMYPFTHLEGDMKKREWGEIHAFMMGERERRDESASL